MRIRIGTEARDTALTSIEDERDVFEAASALPDLSLAHAPLASSATEMFRSSWDDAAVQYRDLIDAVVTTLGVVANALIELDDSGANSTTAEAPRTSGPR